MAIKFKCRPIKWKRISQYYKKSTNKGIDLAAPTGTKVYAVANGTVVKRGYGVLDRSYGNQVFIYHGNWYYTNYAHLSNIKGRTGQKVKAGQCIGLCGSTGHSTGPHLHFELWTKRSFSARVDPYPYIKAATRYTIGRTYVLLEDMNIRVGYPPNGKLKPKVPVSKWTAYAKKHATKSGLLKKGTRITFDDFVTVGDETWVHLKSGWMCASGSKTYIKEA